MNTDLMKAIQTFINAEAIKIHESGYSGMTESEKLKFEEESKEVTRICSQLKKTLTEEQWQLIVDLKSVETFKNLIINDHMFTMGFIKGINENKYLKDILNECNNLIEK